jgi:hypothetical protein
LSDWSQLVANASKHDDPFAAIAIIGYSQYETRFAIPRRFTNDFPPWIEPGAAGDGRSGPTTRGNRRR